MSTNLRIHFFYFFLTKTVSKYLFFLFPKTAITSSSYSRVSSSSYLSHANLTCNVRFFERKRTGEILLFSMKSLEKYNTLESKFFSASFFSLFFFPFCFVCSRKFLYHVLFTFELLITSCIETDKRLSNKSKCGFVVTKHVFPS